MKWLTMFASLAFSMGAPRTPGVGVPHGTTVIFSIMGNHAAIAADSGTVDPRDGARRTDRCKVDILTDPAALIGVGGAVVLGDERWALDILASATRDHRPIDQKSARALIGQFKNEMEAQMLRYPILWGSRVDLQAVVIIPATRGQGFFVLVFQGIQQQRNGSLLFDVKNFDLLPTEGDDKHGALEIGVRVMNEIDDATSDRAALVAGELRRMKTPREFAVRTVDVAKAWYPDNVFGSTDVATLDSGIAHLYRSTVCSRAN
jgi:hypothetical protein